MLNPETSGEHLDQHEGPCRADHPAAGLNTLPPAGGRPRKLSTYCISMCFCASFCCHGRFSSFPEVLYDIMTLETVLLGNNQVCGLDPGRLIKLLSLSTLDLSNNDLLSVPPELGLCTSLR